MSKHFKETFIRDKHRCVYCGKYLLQDFDTFMITEVDHLYPRSKGGEDKLENTVTSCSVCNRFKGNYIPDIEFSSENRKKYIDAIRIYVMRKRTEYFNKIFVDWIK